MASHVSARIGPRRPASPGSQLAAVPAAETESLRARAEAGSEAGSRAAAR